MSKITVKSIDELLKYEFFIPAYQRGYRWTERQVEDLLNDIDKFTPEVIDNSTDKTWYCLQPVVVKGKQNKNIKSFLEGLNDIASKKNETEAVIKTKNLIKKHEDFKEWEVIDGQQRLTTIFLILTYLSSSKFNIGFATRNDKFLNQVSDLLENYKLSGDLSNNIKVNIEISNHYTGFIKSHLDCDNIDNFHMFRAFLVIKKWFETHEKEKFSNTFLKHVKVIWFETQEEDAIEIFTRINMGKIPLTNAELIKALFLNSSNLKDADPEKLWQKQLEIASEWDRMEYALQDDAFWYFVNKEENKLDTRIEFIFNQMADKTTNADEYFTFRYFSEKFKDNSNSETVEKNWQEIKKYYLTLEEWFADRELYHKIGFLITSGVDINKILDYRSGNTKIGFRENLDQRIKSKVNVQLKDLEYKKNYVQDVLLLHNILTTLRSDDISLRFPFDKYKDKNKGDWSIEHIHAQSSKEITEIDDFENWYQTIDKEVSTSTELRAQIEEFERNPDKNKIPSLVENISALFGETEVHSIDNLALLSKVDNSKLNNGLFPVKRARIIELEKEGAFIPICTKKVFQKYYDGCTKQITKWEEADRESYFNDIKDTLIKYLPEQIQSIYEL